MRPGSVEASDQIQEVIMNQSTPVPTELNALNKEYRAYIDKLKADWLSRNRMRSGDVYETMRPEERHDVHRRIGAWTRYITPLAEAWWKERGYAVIWPEDDSKPMKVQKLEVI